MIWKESARALLRTLRFMRYLRKGGGNGAPIALKSMQSCAIITPPSRGLLMHLSNSLDAPEDFPRTTLMELRDPSDPSDCPSYPIYSLEESSTGPSEAIEPRLLLESPDSFLFRWDATGGADCA